jgi:cobalt-zinc-cadmium efflux system membrane fusion protein
MRVLVILAVLSSVAFAHEDHEPLPTKGAAVKGDRLMLSASAAKAIGMQLGKVTLADVSRTIQAVGSIELPWSQQAYVSTLIAGRVEQVLVKPGESVTAGQELARISGTELESLQSEMLQAATERSLAERLLKGQESAGTGIAGRVLLQTRTLAQQQSARFNAAWQKLRAIGFSNATLQQICDTRETVPAISLLSPIRGVVAKADARAGQIVQPTNPLYHIVDPSRVWMVANVLEADAGQVKAGQPLEVSLAMLPDKIQGTIDHVELRLNPDRTLSVKAILANSGVLKPGMFGRIRIQLASAKAVVCPLEALIRDGQATEALVQQSPGNYLRKPVVVAAVNGQVAEIEDGLFPGDEVITVGSHELAALFPKQPVRQVKRADRSTGVTAQGQVELPIDQKAFASAPIDGLVSRILVEHGQRVEKGEVLAELESLPFKTLQLDFLQARTSLAQATANLERAKALGDNLAKKDLWQLQTSFDAYQQTVASLRRQLMLVGVSDIDLATIEETDLTGTPQDLSAVLPIRSPANGLVGDFDLVPGQFVASKTQLFELHNPRTVWVRAFVFEQDAGHVRIGQPVQVALASDPAFHASGQIDRLDPMLLGGTRALSIWTELDNPGLKLKEGMAATLSMGD